MARKTTVQDFLKNERVIIYPKKKEKLLLVLGYLVSKFEKDRHYSESEVNNILDKHIAYRDHMFYRRELIDYGLLVRTIDGKDYWRNN